ncbi:MAG: InlB B-repeat-containing protein, partial [Ruminococcus sp.]|nr:InlB B-repeat-containing protein [Ruminococcus sp.]
SNTTGTGGNISDNNAYDGTISVTVKDKNGNIIGSDSHTGEVTSSTSYFWTTYNYNGIIDHNLQQDMDDVTIGIFEGDKRNVKDLLGESAILHITCVQSTVSNGTINSGSNYISLTNESGDYYITGNTAGTSTTGDAEVSITIKKGSCKFHEQSSASATTTVYVFKKPTTSTTAYTLTLTGNLDSRCRYFIDGNEGVKQADGTILFEGLNPNTRYMVEVQAEYKDNEGDTRYTYAYVYDTTKPIYNGTVEVFLNGTYDSATHTAQGTRVNLEDVTNYSTLYAKDENSTEFVELQKKANTTGIYSSILDTGSYHLYYTASDSTKIDDQLLTMHQADRTRYLFYNSVIYKDGDTQLGNTEYYVTGSSVTTRPAITKDGYVFAGWQDENGKVYPADATLTDSISAPYVLEAVWTKSVNVTVNVVLDHTAEDGSIDSNKAAKFDVSFDLMHGPFGSDNDYADVLAPVVVDDTNYTAEKTTNEDGFVTKTVYTAKAPNLANVARGMEYAVESSKSHYETIGFTEELDGNGNVTLTVTLKFTPTNSDLDFKVVLDDAAQALVEEHPQYKPLAADVKVSFWSDTAFSEYTTAGWHHIIQHHDRFVTVPLNDIDSATGNYCGTGTYPVWTQVSENVPYYYRIEVVSFVLSNGDTVYTDTADDVVYVTPAGRYKATVNVSGGMIPTGADTTLTGAYFDANGNQQGDITGVVSIKTHTVTFEPDGGKFADGTETSKSEGNLLNVPDLSEYTVTRDGGYTFLGWYEVDKETGKTTDVLATSSKILNDDLTLRAVWKAPITVEGVISVAGYYYLDDNRNEVRIINEADRTHKVTVLLQKILPNGYAETISSQEIDVFYPDLEATISSKPMGTAQYAFTSLPNDGTQYRILITNPNYLVGYQNEPESIDAEKAGDYSLYNATDFMAELGETDPLVADVNAIMVFDPTDFTLFYKVIASSIGEGFRPSTAEVLVLYNDLLSGSNPQNWPVISQMVKGDTIKGNDTTMSAAGIGEDSEIVWRSMADGHTLYDYAVKLKDYTINGTETQYVADSAPFFVYYNGSARYSAHEGLNPDHQTQLLTIELAPKRYNVNFDVNFTETETDHIENFEKYTILVDNKPVYHTGHIWSYETDLSDAIPTREGYKFLGWYDKKGNLVTKVDASVAQDVNLTAKWEELFTVTFHANNDLTPEDIFRVYYEQGEAPQGALTLNADNTVEAFYDIPQFTYTDHNKFVFKGWYLDKDNSDNSRPVKWTDVYNESIDVYAHWIEVGTVEKDAADSKNTGSDFYNGYDLSGVQIRDVKKDDILHYGTPGTGLRFVTVLSDELYDSINSIETRDGQTPNASGAEYGYVIAKTATANKAVEYYGADKDTYRLEYCGENVNGVDTTKTYKYVQNVKCSGVPDHKDYDEYRLYTAVITYKDLEGDALAAAHDSAITAR